MHKLAKIFIVVIIISIITVSYYKRIKGTNDTSIETKEYTNYFFDGKQYYYQKEKTETNNKIIINSITSGLLLPGLPGTQLQSLTTMDYAWSNDNIFFMGEKIPKINPQEIIVLTDIHNPSPRFPYFTDKNNIYWKDKPIGKRNTEISIIKTNYKYTGYNYDADHFLYNGDKTYHGSSEIELSFIDECIKNGFFSSDSITCEVIFKYEGSK